MRALDAARRADVALVLVDAQEGIVDQDLHVADEARKAGCATLVVLSKWDVVEIDLEDSRRAAARQAAPAPAARSRPRRVTGRGLDRLLRAIDGLFTHYTSRVQTPRSATRSWPRRQSAPPAADRAATAVSRCSTARRCRRGRRASG